MSPSAAAHRTTSFCSTPLLPESPPAFLPGLCFHPSSSLGSPDCEFEWTSTPVTAAQESNALFENLQTCITLLLQDAEDVMAALTCPDSAAWFL